MNCRHGFLRDGRMPLVLALVAAACSTPPSLPIIAPISIQQDTARISQPGHGRAATFEVCRGEICPRRTPKTLAPAASVPATSPMARSPLIQPLPKPHPQMAPERLPAEEGAQSASISTSEHPQPPRVPIEQVLHIPFGFASARLEAAAQAALSSAGPALARAQAVHLLGRTDSTGPASTNEVLARARAESVRQALLALLPGLVPRLTTESQGACCFVAANDSAAGRARNRRVELRYHLDSDDPP